MEEGKILQWRVKVGDVIAVKQIICEVETDKAAVDVEATAAGRIVWLANEGAVIPVKQPIALLGDAPGGGTTLASTPPPATSAPSAVPAVAAPNQPGAAPGVGATDDGVALSQGRVKASPAARKAAAENGIDLASVGTGTGPGGRILSSDLPHQEVRAAAPAGPIGTLSGTRKPVSKMRRAIALNLQASKQAVPHFYLKLTIDADPLLAFYHLQKSATGCTLNDVILLAVGRTVGEFPAFRSRWDGDEILEMAAANIGVAVNVLEGLVVPVVLNVYALTLAQLAAETRRIIAAARAGKIENTGKAVFTISNMGMLGVEDFAAIINPPESGILAISAAREAAIAKDGILRAGRVMAMTLSVDHRVVDGAVAAQWMNRLRQLLENPELLQESTGH